MSKRKKNILKELKRLDKDLINLIKKRSEMLSQYVKKKIQDGNGVVDSDLEKELWKIWNELVHLGFDDKLLRKVFNYLNWIGYELKVETKNEDNWKFILNPSVIPVDIDIPGPKDRLYSKFWIIVHAGAGKPFEFRHVVLNDSMHELLKALNLANGDFSWAKDKVIFEAKRKLNFEQRPIFVGEDKLNLYLMVFLSLAFSGKIKFTGGNKLKILNLDPLFKILSQLGARGVSLIPHAEGLPIKVEASGIFQDSIVITQKVDDELIVSLILCSIFYKTPSGFLKILYPYDFEKDNYLHRVFDIFKELNVRWEKTEKEFIIYNHDFEIPDDLEICLDPILTGFILAFPQAVGGKVVLKGRYPLWFDEGKDVLDILLASDLKIDVFEDRVESIKGPKKPSYYIDPHNRDLFPLALAIGFLCEPEAIVKIEDNYYDLSFLEDLEVKFDIRENLLYLYNISGRSFPRVNLTIKDPIWNLAYALMSFKRPYICLEDPGSITALWPQFWNIYKSASRCRSWDIGEDKKDEQSRRRIIVG